ncbi:MAG: sugar transferase [Thermoanaerobaculia bacterium]|nr:sugar transferase [Thermoanaerobaculia bacterium]
MSQHRRQFLLAFFQLIDLLIMVAAFSIAMKLTGIDPASATHISEVSKFLFVVGLPIIWHWTFSFFGLYHTRRLSSGVLEAWDVFRAASLSSLLIMSLGLILELAPPSVEQGQVRTFMLEFWMLVTGLTIVARLLLRLALEKARLRGRNLRHVLVAGTNQRALDFAHKLAAKPELGYSVVGFVDDDWYGLGEFRQRGYRLVANFETLSEYLRDNVVDEMVVALPFSSSYKRSARIVSLCEQHGITVRFVSQIFDVQLAKAKVESFHEEPVFTLHMGEMAMESSGMMVKRFMDLTLSLLALIALVPLFVLIAIGVKLTSTGPVLFAQERVGLNKRRFKLFKFRTMVVDAEARLAEIAHLNEVSGPVFKIANDPRVTRFGSFLRKTSLDELPQLINVFLGDMSLVGPRPLPVRDYEGFDQDWHRRRVSVRPGITCFWQVEGRSSIPFEKWMELDMKYIDNWSPWLDLKLLFRTLPALITSPGDKVAQPIENGRPLGRRCSRRSGRPRASKKRTPRSARVHRVRPGGCAGRGSLGAGRCSLRPDRDPIQGQKIILPPFARS